MLILNATVIYVSGLIFNVAVCYMPEQVNKYGHQWQMTHDKVFHIISIDTVCYCLKSSQLPPLQLVPGGIHWNKNVILTKFSSLHALEVVMVTIPVHPVTKISTKLHLFPFQYKTEYFFWVSSVKITAYHFDKCLGSTDAETPVKFHSAYDSMDTNLGDSKLRKILW